MKSEGDGESGRDWGTVLALVAVAGIMAAAVVLA